MMSLKCSRCLDKLLNQEKYETFCVFCGDSIIGEGVKEVCCADCSQNYGVCMTCGEILENEKKDID